MNAATAINDLHRGMKRLSDPLEAHDGEGSAIRAVE